MVGSEDTEEKVASAALVAVTVQVPAVVTLRSDPVTVQPVAVPSVATNVMAPAPEPPVVVSGSGVPTVPLSDVMVSAVWVPRLKVTVVGSDDTSEWVASAALVAVTVQVPAVVTLRLDPVTVQPVAVPSVATR